MIDFTDTERVQYEAVRAEALVTLQGMTKERIIDYAYAQGADIMYMQNRRKDELAHTIAARIASNRIARQRAETRQPVPAARILPTFAQIVASEPALQDLFQAE